MRNRFIRSGLLALALAIAGTAYAATNRQRGSWSKAGKHSQVSNTCTQRWTCSAYASSGCSLGRCTGAVQTSGQCINNDDSLGGCGACTAPYPSDECACDVSCN